MATARKKKPPALLTAEDLYHMKKRLDGKWFEISEGLPVLCEPGGFEHSGIGINLITYLNLYVRTNNLGVVVGPDCTFVLRRNPDTVRCPDVAFVREERIPPGRLTPKFFEGQPDLAVEIISPSDRFPAVEKKINAYLDAGTRLVWVIRPSDYSAFVRRVDGTTETLTTQDSFDGEDVIPGFQCRLGELFRS